MCELRPVELPLEALEERGVANVVRCLDRPDVHQVHGRGHVEQLHGAACGRQRGLAAVDADDSSRG